MSTIRIRIENGNATPTHIDGRPLAVVDDFAPPLTPAELAVATPAYGDEALRLETLARLEGQTAPAMPLFRESSSRWVRGLFLAQLLKRWREEDAARYLAIGGGR